MRCAFMVGYLALLLLAACAQATPETAPSSSPTPQTSEIVPTIPTVPTVPTKVGTEPEWKISFNMKDEYRLGEPVEIGIRNGSDGDYYYQSTYPGCFNLKFFDGSNVIRPYPNAEPARTQIYLLPGQFVVPEGTHCDLIAEQPLEPGQSVALFTWGQHICIKDRWGCMESLPVESGEYLVQGEFSNVKGGISPGSAREPESVTTIKWSFTIQPN